ncbi:ATP-binding protein [Spirillospora sp. CA-253888]
MSPEPEADISALVIESVPESIKKARDFTARWFADQGFDERSAHLARLAVTELVTNAHKHATRPGDNITVRLYRTEAGPLIEVWDPSPALPTIKPLDLTSEDGRGLAMLSLLITAWGTNATANGGKVVWALLGQE